MAASAVFSVLTKLAEPIFQEAVLLHGVSDDVDWLASEMRWMQSFLKDAETKRRRDRSNLINNWVRDVRELAQEAEDIIDTFMATIEPRQRRQRRTGGLMGRMVRYACLSSELKPRHKIGTEIQQLRAKIQRIKACKDTYGLVDLGQTSAARPIDEDLHELRRIAPHLHSDDTVLVGFDAHKEAIMGQLLDIGIKKRCAVSIVGTGGIGKTTLATKIYNNSKIRAGFHTHACVSVSQTPQYVDMLKRIAKDVLSISMNELQSTEIYEVERKLYEFLNEKRYLIILDDVWSPNVWSRMNKVLPDVKNGSRVLVTTRSMEVATSACTCIKPYELSLLDDQQSWQLFLKNAFPQIEDANSLCCPEALEEVGGKLVNKCGGLPLALVALGGLVSRKDPTHAEWARVANRMDWASTEDGQNCINILALSYDDLPHHHLKSCFLYLAVFPEDHRIRDSEVVNLWVAEGLIPEARTRTMEETARSYLNELTGRSMIQPNYSPWEPSPFYRVHDLFHDFCISEARNDGILGVYCSNAPPGEMRHDHNPCRRLALHDLDLSTNEVNWCPAPNLRSLLTFGTKVGNGEIFNGLKLMRVVHFETYSTTSGYSIFPKQLLESPIHLRYLCLGGLVELTELPSSIGSFCNLQTLDLSGTAIESLPGSIGKMQMLRHLYLPFASVCECPPDICNLKNLRTLDGAAAGGGWIEHGSEKLVNMERLVVHEQLGGAEGEVLLHSLGKMKRLTSLHLGFDEAITAADSFACFSNLDQLVWMELWGRIPETSHLVFPPNLTTLYLYDSRLEQDPMAVLEKLPNLTALCLESHSYEGTMMNCTTGGFPSLQQLVVRQLYGLEDWRVGCGAMPKLNLLKIERCRSLAMLPEGLQHLTFLKRLEVYDEREEFLRRLEREVGEDWLKIRHVSTIIFQKYD